jgi:hypothetical protein
MARNDQETLKKCPRLFEPILQTVKQEHWEKLENAEASETSTDIVETEGRRASMPK